MLTHAIDVVQVVKLITKHPLCSFPLNAVFMSMQIETAWVVAGEFEREYRIEAAVAALFLSYVPKKF